MPPACPGELHVRRYTKAAPSCLPPFAAAGERGRCWRAFVCSSKRKHPPDKPGAFADARTDCISQRYDYGPT